MIVRFSIAITFRHNNFLSKIYVSRIGVNETFTIMVTLEGSSLRIQDHGCKFQILIHQSSLLQMIGCKSYAFFQNQWLQKYPQHPHYQLPLLSMTNPNSIASLLTQTKYLQAKVNLDSQMRFYKCLQLRGLRNYRLSTFEV